MKNIWVATTWTPWLKEQGYKPLPYKQPPRAGPVGPFWSDQDGWMPASEAEISIYGGDFFVSKTVGDVFFPGGEKGDTWMSQEVSKWLVNGL